MSQQYDIYNDNLLPLSFQIILPSFFLSFIKNFMFAYQNSNHLVNTQEFDGPLELLLYLVKKSSVDVREIEITQSQMHISNTLKILNSLIWT